PRHVQAEPETHWVPRQSLGTRKREKKEPPMKFSIKSLLTLVAFAALLLAAFLRYRAIQTEAADLAAEVYRMRLLHQYSKPYGSLFPPGLNAIVLGKGTIVDLRTSAGRREMMARLERGDLDFRIRCSDGRIMVHEELFAAPFEGWGGPRTGLIR
ncbi:MAG: hypothetical protein D6753_13390, partial [Planctomycetota bacterium]